MFYTKLIIQASDEAVMIETYTGVLAKRWEFISVTTTGGTLAHRLTADGEWTRHPGCVPGAYDSTTSKANFDSVGMTAILLQAFPVGTNYYESIRFWESAAIAQDFVAAVQALNLAGVAVSYEGDTDFTEA